MYAIYLNAIPDESNQDYDRNQYYPIIVVVNTLSEGYAIEKAEKILREDHWEDINFQRIGKIPKENQATDNPVTDYRIYVFPDAKKSAVKKLAEKAKILIGKFAHVKR